MGPTHAFEDLKKTIQPGDVLLVEGRQRFSTGIKYLTQSNWSHSALFTDDGNLVEADLKEGVRVIPLEEYSSFHTRICRPVHLAHEDLKRIMHFTKSRIGNQYDLKNILDLAKYLFPFVPIPTRFRRKVLELGAGDPTKVICSSLIAEAFQDIGYPVLPDIMNKGQKTFFRKRHHTLITPADFDRSPYFNVVKPTIFQGFDFKGIDWDAEHRKTL